MIPETISFVWASGPIMNAIFTIVFLLLLRMWSRSESKIIKPTTKLGETLVETSKEIVETAKTAEKFIEGFTVDEAKKAIEETSTNTLDTQFFGELFVASLVAGCVIKFIW